MTAGALAGLAAAARAGGPEGQRVLRDALRADDRSVREPALRIAGASFPEDQLVAMLREPADDVIRSAALEMLVQRGAAVVPLLGDLLSDRDPDVVLQAILALDRIRDHRAVEGLLRVLDHPHPNVVQAAITAVGHLGSRAAVGRLLRFLDGDLWLRAAAIEALGDLRAPSAAPALAGQLTDPIVGTIAAEALARIGGADAFAQLARHWLGITGSGEEFLGRLAHVAETSDERVATPEGLRGALCVMLRHHDPALRVAAGRCLLALGPGTGDRDAVMCLAASAESDALPDALRRRADLIPDLLLSAGVRRAWGLRLLVRHPYAVPMRVVERAVAQPVEPAGLTVLAEALLALAEPRLAEAIIAVYANAGDAGRPALVPVITAYRGHIRAVLPGMSDVPADVRAVLEAILSEPAEAAMAVAAMREPRRIEALLHLADRPAVLALLPWATWLAEAPERYAPLAVQFAARAGLRQAAPEIRVLLTRGVHPGVIRLVGVLRDEDAVPLLLPFITADDPVRGPWAIAALGSIGGMRARGILREVAASDGPWVRNAFRALAECRDEGDLSRFRHGLTHSDWNVRLISLTVLGIARRAEDRTALALMTADPIRAVADRARGILAR